MIWQYKISFYSKDVDDGKLPNELEVNGNSYVAVVYDKERMVLNFNGGREVENSK